MILNTSRDSFLQKQRFAYDKNALIVNYSRSNNELATLADNYAKSLLVLVSEKPTSRTMGYPGEPILPIPLIPFFLIGAAVALSYKKPFTNTLILLTVVIPFTNSAMTDWINADYRLLPLLPICAYLAALGFEWVIKLIKNPTFKYLIIVCLFLYLIYRSFIFFTSHEANGGRNVNDFLSMHIIYFLRNDAHFMHEQNNKLVCMFVSPANFQNLELAHYKEQYAYFLPEVLIDKRKTEIGNNVAYLFKGACPQDYRLATHASITICNKNKFECPNNYRGKNNN